MMDSPSLSKCLGPSSQAPILHRACDPAGEKPCRLSGPNGFPPHTPRSPQTHANRLTGQIRTHAGRSFGIAALGGIAIAEAKIPGRGRSALERMGRKMPLFSSFFRIGPVLWFRAW